MMKILFISLCFFLSCKSKVDLVPLSQLEEQEARGLFQRHLMAIGGEMAVKAHSAMLIRGTLEELGKGKQNTFTIQKKAPNFYYIQINLLELGIYERGFDGETFWERTPRSAKMLTLEEAKPLLPSIDFYADLNWIKWYPKIMYREVAEFGGEVADILTVENYYGQQEKIIFSRDSGLKIGQIKNIGADNETVIRFGQYIIKNDVRIPMYIEEKLGDLHKIWLITSFTWDRSDVDFRPPPILMEER